MIARVRSADAAPPIRRDKSEGGNYFAHPKTNLKFINSGCHTLDLALGGGWARGRIANIIGDKSTGKTLLCIEASANFAVQEKKGKIRYREAEAAFDEPYAGALGMPLDRIDFGADKPLETVEDLFEDLQKIVKGARGPELVIVDSLDALSDRAEMERSMDEGSYGTAKAKLMSELFRRLVQKMEDKDVTLLIVSQIRDRLDAAKFGRKFTRTGGRALDFYASQCLLLAHIARIVKEVSKIKRATGVRVLGKVDKNKVALPFRESGFSIRFGYGIDDAQACVDWLKETGSLKLAGIKPDETAGYLDYILEDLSAEEGAAEMKRLRDIVTDRWYEIERKMLPPRSKYGPGS